MLSSNVTGENSFLDDFKNKRCDITSRKQVRFDTPSKSDPRLFDVQVPKPFGLNATRPLRSMENFHDVSRDRVEQRKKFHVNSYENKLTLLSQQNMPKPSNELELSLLDSQVDEFENNLPPPKPKGIYPSESQIYRRDNEFDTNFIYREERPYAILPEKTTFSNFNMMSQSVSPNRAKTDFLAEDLDSVEESSFFTLPNSKSDVFQKYGRKTSETPARSPQNEIIRPANSYRETVNINKIENENNSQISKRQILNQNKNRPISKNNNDSPEYLCENCENCHYKINQKSMISNQTINNRKHMYNKTNDNIEEKRNMMHENDVDKRCHRFNSQNHEETIDKYNPTISDLYDLLEMQVQQLQILQRRVDHLSNMKQHQKNVIPDYMKLLENEMLTNMNSDGNKNDAKEEIQHISIGVMTSFEITVSSNKINHEKSANVYIDEGVQTSNYFMNREIDVEDEQHDDNTGVMNFLDGIKPYSGENFQNVCGPVTSTKLLNEKLNCNDNIIKDMTKPEKENVDCSDDECSQPGIGWTFYNRVIGHVNKILRTPPEHLERLDIRKTPKQNISILKLNQMGLDMSDTNTSKKVTFDFQQTKTHKRSSDTSLHMNKLAMKYLNDDAQKLVENSRKNDIPISRPQTYQNEYFEDMSISTIQYMQKHNILSGNNNMHRNYEAGPSNPYHLKNDNYIPRPGYKDPNRILDITALRRQPKLL